MLYIKDMEYRVYYMLVLTQIERRSMLTKCFNQIWESLFDINLLQNETAPEFHA